MRSGPSARRDHFDLINDLTENVEGTKDPQNSKKNEETPKCRHIKVTIKSGNKDLEVWALVDLGSHITCISEKFYKEIISEKSVEELPVANLLVSVAVGKKAVAIKRQIWLDYLTSHMILGYDWHWKSGLNLDYINGKIKIKNQTISDKSVRFERSSADKIVLSKKMTLHMY